MARPPQIVDRGDMQVLADIVNQSVLVRVLNRIGARIPEDWTLSPELARALAGQLAEAADAVAPRSEARGH